MPNQTAYISEVMAHTV